MAEDQVRKEMGVHPLDWETTIRTLPWQHVIVFRKRADAAGAPAASRGTDPR